VIRRPSTSSNDSIKFKPSLPKTNTDVEIASASNALSANMVTDISSVAE